MKSIARLALSSTLAISLNSARAQTCNEVLDQCDAALTSCMQLVEAHEAEEAALRRMLNHKNEEINDLNAWYRKPQYVIPASLLIGIVGGMYLAK